jgi:nitrite reductase/ring-hydroxylating ferredoxin subunit/uncharacterized membrane protein
VKCCHARVSFLMIFYKKRCMKSKANIKSHPLHPILVAFPIAFFVGTFLFDVVGLINGDASLHDTACRVEGAGIIFALLAAVPGVIDYIYTVPPKSSAKSRATKHGLINVSNVVLFTFVLFYRQSHNANIYIVAVLELVGVAILSVAGWMGGTLVHRNQIGVDIRYANAGKWKEQYVEAGDKVEVAKVDELQVDQMKLIHVKDKRIVIAKTEDGYVAFDDRCTHKGGSLAGGAIMCGTVQCPWHGSQFDVKTGVVKAGPAKEGIKTYKVSQQGSKIFLSLV